MATSPSPRLNIKVFTGPTAVKPFRFGNGGIALVPQQLGENSVMLGMFTLDAEKVPILIGMRTLDRLGAVIDVSGRSMVLSNVAPDLKIPLGKSKAGHLLVDLRTDWLTMGQPLEQHAPRSRAAYKAKVSSPPCAVDPMTSQAFSRHATHDMLNHMHTEHCTNFESPQVHEQALVVERCVEAEGHESGEDLEAAYMLDPHDHHRRPLAQADQVMRDGILSALANDPSLAHGAQEAKEKKKSIAPASERYDYSRTQGINKDDPRATGPPCHGEHTPSMPGRGSNAGSNAHAAWIGRSECGIRMSYTPAFGARGLTRQAGPLTADAWPAEAGEGQHRAEQEDRPGCGRALFGEAHGNDPQAEGSVGGQQRKDKYSAETTSGSPTGQGPGRPSRIMSGYPKDPDHHGPDRKQEEC